MSPSLVLSSTMLALGPHGLVTTGLLTQAEPLIVQGKDANASVSRFDPLFHETGIPLAIMGMMVVFLALAILIVIITALPRVLGLLERKSGSKDVVANVKSTVTELTAAIPDDQELSPELIAVLAAAAEFELGPVRIVRTRPLTSAELAWTLEGRLRHHASHQLQTRNR